MEVLTEVLLVDGTLAVSPELTVQKDAPNPWYATTIPTAGIQSPKNLGYAGATWRCCCEARPHLASYFTQYT